MRFFSGDERRLKKIDRPPSRPVRCKSHDSIDFGTDERQHATQNSLKQWIGNRRHTAFCIIPARRRKLLILLLTSLFISASILRSLFSNLDASYNDATAATTLSFRSLGLMKILARRNASKNSRTRGLLQALNQFPDDILTVHRGPTTVAPNATGCIVTAYFRVKSKYADETYERDWMGNMLSLEDCMVIFCEEHMVESMLQARAHRPTIVLSIPLDHLPMAQYIGAHHDTSIAFWQHQLEMDPEQKLHKSYQLFWIWLSKTWFVVIASLWQERLFKTDTLQTFMWADIGSFRNGDFAGKRLLWYPQSLLRPNDARTVVWMAHHTPNPPQDPFWNQKLKQSEKHHFYHSGSHGIASTVEAWVNYYIHFVDIFDQYASRGLFAGEDQCVLQTTCLMYPETCAYLPFNKVKDNHYFGLRHALHFGNQNAMFDLWHPPAVY